MDEEAKYHTKKRKHYEKLAYRLIEFIDRNWHTDK